MSKYGTFDYITEMEVHLKALEHEHVSMDKDEPIRWDLVTEIRTGGSWRLGICTSQRVVAMHPSGIEMWWHVELEPSSANGSGRLQLDIDLIRNLLDKAPRHATIGLREWLRESKQTIDKEIEQQVGYLSTMRQISDLFEESMKESPNAN